jgi:hypothetical protein
MTAPQPAPPRALPRRANTIRALAGTMANRKVAELAQRQSVSDKIGYALAVCMGAVTFRYLGVDGVGLLATVYLGNAWLSYRKWKAARR